MITSDDLAVCSAFAPLSDEQRTRLAHLARIVEFEPSAALLREGEPAVGCWLIRSGRVALETAAPAGGPIVVQTLGPGELVGWSWLAPPHRWHFSATATTRVEAIEFDTDAVRAIADADPTLGYPLALGLTQTLLNRLQNTRGRLLDLYGSPRDRRD